MGAEYQAFLGKGGKDGSEKGRELKEMHGMYVHRKQFSSYLVIVMAFTD